MRVLETEQGRLIMHASVLMLTSIKEMCSSHLPSSAWLKLWKSLSSFEWNIFLQAVLKTGFRRSGSQDTHLCSKNAFSKAFEAIILLHSLPSVCCLTTREAVSTYMLLAPVHWLAFGAETVASALGTVSRSSGMILMVRWWLMFFARLWYGRV